MNYFPNSLCSTLEGWFSIFLVSYKPKYTQTDPTRQLISINLFPVWPQFSLLFGIYHSVHRGINPPSKTPLPSFLPSPPLNLQTVQAPLFKYCPLYIGFSWTPPPKSWIFQWAPKISKCFILNPILSFKSNEILS